MGMIALCRDSFQTANDERDNSSSGKTNKSLPRKDLNIIFCGPTGSGKSSIINFFHLWSQNLQNLRDAKKVMIQTEFLQGDIIEGDRNDETESRTKNPSNYCFNVETNDCCYHLTCLDTPGTGDTDGIEKDESNITNTLEMLAKSSEINAICLVFNGSDPRAHAFVRMVVAKIKSFLPDTALSNLFGICTNTALRPNLNFTKYFPTAKLVCIDNLLFKVDLRYEDIDVINTNYTKTKIALSSLLRQISEISPISPQVYVIVNADRKTLRLEIHFISQVIEKDLHLQFHILRLENEIHSLKMNEMMEKVRIPVKSESIEKVPTIDHHTTCLVHNTTCHEHCSLKETKQKGNNIFHCCAAFCDGSTCSECRCTDISEHRHERFMIVKKETVEYIIDQNALNRINFGQSEKEKKELLKKDLEQKRIQIQAQILEKRDKLLAAFRRLKETCSGYNLQEEIDSTAKVLELQTKAAYAQRQMEPAKAQEHMEKIQSLQKLKTIYDEISKQLNLSMRDWNSK